MSQVFLSVIIPSYNEMQNVKRGVLDQVNDYLKKQKYSWEVILSDDGSNDGTTDAINEFAKKHSEFRVLANKHAGKGPTVQNGMLAAQGEWRLFTDFDQSTPISEVEKLMSFTHSGFQVVIGSRELSGARRQDEPWYRHLMGRGFNFLVQLMAIPGIQDTQCGFKLFSADAATRLFSNLKVYGNKGPRTDAFTGAFDVEVLYLARKYGYKIKEVAVQWQHFESKRVSPIKDSIRMFHDIFKIRVAELQRQYADQ